MFSRPPGFFLRNENMNYSYQELIEMLAVPDTLSGQPTECEREISEEEKLFLEERRTMLGGTDSAAICGFSAYRNAWDVAAEKKGILPTWFGNERTEIGQLLEDPVAQVYERRTGTKLERVTKVIRDTKSPFLGAHPDRIVQAEKKGVEIKTVGFGFDKWSNPGEPIRVPKDYYIQCQHYMMVTGYRVWDLVALFGLAKIRWYTIERNESVIAALREKGERFWAQYIEGDDLPPLEPSDRAKDWLRDRFSAPTSETIVLANQEQEKAISHWIEAKASREKFAAEEEKWKIRVQAAIGDATGISSNGLTVTWKKNRDTVGLITDWESVAEIYREQLLRITSQHRHLIEAIPEKFTRQITKKGHRVLRVQKHEE